MSLAHEKYLELQRLRNAAPITLEPHRTALVIIDMQEYFLHPDSPLSRACEAQVPGVLHYFQEHGRSVAEPTLQRLLAYAVPMGCVWSTQLLPPSYPMGEI
jgi:nicotinamidase-related amidase